MRNMTVATDGLMVVAFLLAACSIAARPTSSPTAAPLSPSPSPVSAPIATEDGPPEPDPQGLPNGSEWRPLLQPLVEAINLDRRNFAEGYSTSEGGPWRMVINVVANADQAATARVASLIPMGAPVEWKIVKYSAEQIDALVSEQGRSIMAGNRDRVSAVGSDYKENAMSVMTRGPQPELEQQLRAQFGDAVVFEVGPVEDRPI